jgi:hypothetical protein
MDDILIVILKHKVLIYLRHVDAGHYSAQVLIRNIGERVDDALLRVNNAPAQTTPHGHDAL